MANTNIVNNSNVVSAKVEDQIDLSILAEEGSVTSFKDISNSREMGMMPNPKIIAEAPLSKANAVKLRTELEECAIDAAKMTTSKGYQHPRSTLLKNAFNRLITKVDWNLRHWDSADWSYFEDHKVSERPYMSKFSYYDQLLVLNTGGMGIVSAKVENYGHIYSTQYGWRLRVKDQGIDVSPERITLLLGTAVAETVQNIAWSRGGVMVGSSNFDGRTMVIRPREGQKHIEITDVITGEVYHFSTLRLSCDYWVYVTMLESLVLAYMPNLASHPEHKELSDLNEKLFGSRKHICARSAEYDFFRFTVALKRSKNPEKLWNSILKEFAPEDLKDFKTFDAKREKNIQANIARSNSKVQIKTVEASEASLNAAKAELDIFGSDDDSF